MKYSGLEVRAATKRNPETDTIYASGPADSPTLMVPLISEDLKDVPEFDDSVGLAGQVGRGEAEVIRRVAGGSLSTEAWFHGLEYLLLCAMGFENPTVYTGVYGTGSGGSPAPCDASPQAYYHVFELDDALEIRNWSASDDRDASSGSDPDPEFWDTNDYVCRTLDIGIDKDIAGTSVKRFRACAVNEMQLNISGDKVSLDWNVLARSSDTDAMNRSNWDVVSRERATFAGVRFYFAAAQAGAWTYSSDQYGIQEMTLKLENGLRRDFQSGPNSVYTEEPIREGFRKVTGQVKLARMNASMGTLLDAYSGANIACNVIVELWGSTIEGAHDHVFRFMLPRVKIANYQAPVSGPGIIQPSFDMLAEKPSANPTWLTTLCGGVALKKTNELVVQLCNTQPACFSRDRQAAGVTLP